MKRTMTIIITMLCLVAAMPASAQMHRGGYGRYGYDRGHRGYYSPHAYFGLRFGMSTSHVNSDAPNLSSGLKSGLNVGAVGGVQVSPYLPMFFETGLEYSEKGGKGSLDGKKFSVGLNYLEIPLVLKYSAQIADATAIEPFIGGYVGLGVSGKVKDYDQYQAYSSYSDNYGANFKRTDGGIRVGCGIAFEFLYAEMGYDFGLRNIGDNAFDDTHNGSLFLNIGVNF